MLTYDFFAFAFSNVADNCLLTTVENICSCKTPIVSVCVSKLSPLDLISFYVPYSLSIKKVRFWVPDSISILKFAAYIKI